MNPLAFHATMYCVDNFSDNPENFALAALDRLGDALARRRTPGEQGVDQRQADPLAVTGDDCRLPGQFADPLFLSFSRAATRVAGRG
jgi:hypothetical protein